nr:hypothetical protein [Hafnia paralvei]
MNKPLAIVAVGGNALIVNEEKNSIHDQYQAVEQSAQHIVDMIEAGWNIVLTHGNGRRWGLSCAALSLLLAKSPQCRLIMPLAIPKVPLVICSKKHCITS